MLKCSLEFLHLVAHLFQLACQPLELLLIVAYLGVKDNIPDAIHLGCGLSHLARVLTFLI